MVEVRIGETEVTKAVSLPDRFPFLLLVLCIVPILWGGRIGIILLHIYDIFLLKTDCMSSTLVDVQ